MTNNCNVVELWPVKCAGKKPSVPSLKKKKNLQLAKTIVARVNGLQLTAICWHFNSSNLVLRGRNSWKIKNRESSKITNIIVKYTRPFIVVWSSGHLASTKIYKVMPFKSSNKEKGKESVLHLKLSHAVMIIAECSWTQNRHPT